MKATFIKNCKNFTGTAKLYRMEPPHEGHEFVVSSAAYAFGSGPETYLFGADENGNIKDWIELGGSFRGSMACDQAIRNAGYDIA